MKCTYQQGPITLRHRFGRTRATSLSLHLAKFGHRYGCNSTSIHSLSYPSNFLLIFRKHRAGSFFVALIPAETVSLLFTSLCLLNQARLQAVCGDRTNNIDHTRYQERLNAATKEQCPPVPVGAGCTY